MIHLDGNNAPVAEERDAVPTQVVGTIPDDLHGTYYRNGPNPRSGWSPHLFAGDGMVHAIRVPDGAYRNRYVRTPLYDDASTRRDGRFVTTANTHVVVHAGRLLALEEGGLPYELTPDLDTIGPFTFSDALHGAMTAHPKTCPVTGELLFFGYAVRPPFLTYHRASADGVLISSQVVELPHASMLHDFAITATKAIFFDSPLVFDIAAMATSGSPWRWDGAHGARIGVVDRDGGDVRWFDVETGHLSHAANANDEGTGVVVRGTRLPPSDDGSGGDLPVMHEWHLDLATGSVRERALDERSVEYPRVADRCVGQPARFTYTAGFWFEAEPDHGEVVRYDHDRGTSTTHRFPAGHTCGEPVFVPRSGGDADDDGYLLTFAHDRARGASYLAVLDAADVAAEPVAEVHLPVRIPGGFHGTWVPD